MGLAKGQLGRGPSGGSRDNGLGQKSVGSICVCVCVFWGWVCWERVGEQRWGPEVKEVFEGPGD